MFTDNLLERANNNRRSLCWSNGFGYQRSNLTKTITSLTRLTIYCTLGKFSKSVATIIWPKSPTFRQFFKLSKSFIVLVKSFFGNFYRPLATFCLSHCQSLTPVDCSLDCAGYPENNIYTFFKLYLY